MPGGEQRQHCPPYPQHPLCSVPRHCGTRQRSQSQVSPQPQGAPHAPRRAASRVPQNLGTKAPLSPVPKQPHGHPGTLGTEPHSRGTAPAHGKPHAPLENRNKIKQAPWSFKNPVQPADFSLSTPPFFPPFALTPALRCRARRGEARTPTARLGGSSPVPPLLFSLPSLAAPPPALPGPAQPGSRGTGTRPRKGTVRSDGLGKLERAVPGAVPIRYYLFIFLIIIITTITTLKTHLLHLLSSVFLGSTFENISFSQFDAE